MRTDGWSRPWFSQEFLNDGFAALGVNVPCLAMAGAGKLLILNRPSLALTDCGELSRNRGRHDWVDRSLRNKRCWTRPGRELEGIDPANVDAQPPVVVDEDPIAWSPILRFLPPCIGMLRTYLGCRRVAGRTNQ